MSDRKRRLSFDIVPGRRRRRPVRWGVMALVATVLIIALGILKPNPFHNPSVVRANFAAGKALPIYPNTPVRVDGVDVGFVKGSTLNDGGGTQLRMEIDNPDVKVYEDARASLYYKILLGRNVYVDLEPGSPDRPEIGDDGFIPQSRTFSQVEVDEVARSFEKQPRAGLQTLFGDFDDGLQGQGARDTIKDAGPALKHTAGALTALRGERKGYDLPRLVQGLRNASTALNRDEAALTGLIDNGAVALGVTAARRADLGSMIDQAPGTLAETRQTMARLRTTLDVLDPVAENLRPGVQRLAPAARAATPTMRAIQDIVPVALPTLRDLQPALTSLAALSRSGVPLMNGLQPTLRRTNTSIIPFLNERSPVTDRRNFEVIGPVFATVSNSASTFDGGGFQQRFQPGSVGSGKALSAVAKGECLRFAPDQQEACDAVLQAVQLALGGGVPAPTGPLRTGDG